VCPERAGNPYGGTISYSINDAGETTGFWVDDTNIAKHGFLCRP
jgi:hypothetical protein